MMAAVSMSAAPAGGTGLRNRWVQLVLGIICMVMIANLQYGWTLFVNPLQAKFPTWHKSDIQWAFTLFVLTETWLVPFEGYLVDRFGPTLLVALAGILVGVAWMINASASSLYTLYAGAIVGGVGAGIVYGMTVGNALKWFPDRRGLAAGLTAAGFGAGSALTIIPIYYMIKSSGYQATFFNFGILQGGIVLIASAFLRAPRKGDVPAVQPVVSQSVRDFTWQEMLRTPAFWLLYIMFTMVATGGIMATAQLGPMAKDYKVADIPVSLFGITLAALPFALSLDRILNGITRPFFGWVSDNIGRENTMFLAFGLEGLAIILLLRLAHIPVAFVVLTGLVFFGWGEIYSLFPATSGDLFGRKWATVNYGLLYTAKGMASLLVPLGSHLQARTGSWVPIFTVAIVFDFCAALLALFVLKSLRARVVSQAAIMAPAGE